MLETEAITEQRDTVRHSHHTMEFRWLCSTLALAHKALHCDDAFEASRAKTEFDYRMAALKEIRPDHVLFTMKAMK